MKKRYRTNEHDRILGILSPALHKGIPAELSAIRRVVDSKSNYNAVKRLLSHHDHDLSILAARCILAAGEAELVEEKHPIVRRAVGYQQARFYERQWRSTITPIGIIIAVLIAALAVSTGVPPLKSIGG